MEEYNTDPLLPEEEELINLMEEAEMEQEEMEILLGQWYALGVTDQVLKRLKELSLHPTYLTILKAGADIVKPLIKRH